MKDDATKVADALTALGLSEDNLGGEALDTVRRHVTDSAVGVLALGLKPTDLDDDVLALMRARLDQDEDEDDDEPIAAIVNRIRR